MLRPGGRTAFITIILSPKLSKAQHRRGAWLGPRSVTSTRPIDVLMEAAGFANIETVDLTADFVTTARGWVRAAEREEEELRRAVGDEAFDEEQSDRKDIVTGVEEGLLRRVLVAGRRPEA